MAPPRGGTRAAKSEGSRSRGTKRTRQQTQSEKKPKKKASTSPPPSSFYQESRWTVAEVGTPAAASGAEICVAEALGAIDFELVASCRALAAAGEPDETRRAVERLAERARTRVAALETSDGTSSSTLEDDPASMAALERQLDAEREAQAELDRLLEEERAAQSDDTPHFPTVTPPPPRQGNRVREALELKGIAASRLADRAGSLNRALAAAKAAQADLFRAFHHSSERDARRLIRTSLAPFVRESSAGPDGGGGSRRGADASSSSSSSRARR